MFRGLPVRTGYLPGTAIYTDYNIQRAVVTVISVLPFLSRIIPGMWYVVRVVYVYEFSSDLEVTADAIMSHGP